MSNRRLVGTTVLAFILINLNSLVNKILFFTDLCIDLNLMVAGICETWLSPDVSSSVISVEGYTLLRNDSPSGQRKHGVCMYIHNNLKVGHVYADHSNTLGVYLPDFRLQVLTV